LGASRHFVAAAPAVYYSGRFTFSLGAGIMAITIEAVYENGVLKPKESLPLQEHERVRVTIEPAISLARQTAGMIPWTGDAETLERIVRVLAGIPAPPG
jgi:predicted DNA-binding antitoxin AbrB/MazE fold protein